MTNRIIIRFNKGQFVLLLHLTMMLLKTLEEELLSCLVLIEPFMLLILVTEYGELLYKFSIKLDELLLDCKYCEIWKCPGIP